MTGVNCDPLNPAGAPYPDELRGFGWVRLVSRPGVEPYVNRCRDAGLMVLAIVNDQSGGYLCPADVYQIHNEPDLNGVSPAAYVSYWNLYRETYPELVMIGAGLGNGQTSYWQQVQAAGGLHGAAGFAVHPYAKTATQARTLLAAYQKVTPSLPLWVTEWHRPVTEVPAFVAMLRQMAVMQAWFCFSDGMVEGFGLSPTEHRTLAAA